MKAFSYRKGLRIHTGHDEIGVRVLFLEMREDLGIRARVVAKPVVIVDPNVSEHLHLMLHLLRHRRSLLCRSSAGRHGWF